MRVSTPGKYIPLEPELKNENGGISDRLFLDLFLEISKGTYN